jgi:hypothetical protein
MAEDTDLLPWVLGGVLTLAAVAASAVVLAGSPADSTPSAAATPANTTPLLPATPPAAQPREADLSPVAVSPKARPTLPPGQVWECVIDGQRIFSDTQCGAHASVRQLSNLNVMDAYEASPGYSRGGYPRDPAPRYGASPDRDPASDAGADEPEADSPVYANSPIIVVHERGRRDHNPRRHNHPHPRATRP